MNTLIRQRGFVNVEWRDDGGNDKPPKAKLSALQRIAPICTLAFFVLMVSMLGLLGYANYRGAEGGVILVFSAVGLASTGCLFFSFCVLVRVCPRT